MRIKLLLLVAVLAITFAQIKLVDLNEKDALADADDFIAEIQGDNENVYVIVF